MKQIFIIKSTLVDKKAGLTNMNEWGNCYAVKTEKEAIKDCEESNRQSEEEHENYSFTIVYKYEKIALI